ncbi:receptor-like protein 49 [Salvia splendens]|uniref:receptor-like protein 49 n=1 Tax=Salvia splendens TaxID=180675 RepID=UPI001C26C9F9|nr:receptor-like protein 49 [Salvia splendens]
MFEKLQALIDASQQPDHLYFSMETVHGVYYQDSVTVTMKNQIYELEKIQTIFTSIDFSDNNLQGAIPPTIGSLKSLYILNFSHNAFSGHIPPALANVAKLQSFDLSFNALVGEIPGQLADLNSLGVLNLSYNHLVGRIPQGSQFNTFTESSYVGNEGLCGFPLDRNCSDEGASQPGEVQGQEEDDVFDGGMYVSAALGFVVGVGIIVAPLFCARNGQTITTSI